MTISIIIPNWNGKKLLEKNLPQVLAAAGNEAEVVIIDDGSTDGSPEFLRDISSQSSRFKISGLSQNHGFAYTVNLGVKKAKGEVVVLLNSDVLPENDFLKPLEEDFADPGIFAVSLSEPQYGWAWGEFKDGYLSHEPRKGANQAHISLWASGGSGAFRKRIWQELRGFDFLYHPFYWEDVDLSYRAWKRGYQILWEPKSVVHHRHESTVSRLSSSYVGLIKQRNELLFIWKNITSPALFREHKKFLIKRIASYPGYSRIFLSAMKKLGPVLRARRQEKSEAKLTDQEIFKFFER